MVESGMGDCMRWDVACGFLRGVVGRKERFLLHLEEEDHPFIPTTGTTCCRSEAVVSLSIEPMAGPSEMRREGEGAHSRLLVASQPRSMRWHLQHDQGTHGGY